MYKVQFSEITMFLKVCNICPPPPPPTRQLFRWQTLMLNISSGGGTMWASGLPTFSIVRSLAHPLLALQGKLSIRVVATVGGAGRGRPPLKISARHFFFFFLVPGTMFHNRGSIIAQYTCYIQYNWADWAGYNPAQYNEMLGTMKFCLLYKIFCYISSHKQYKTKQFIELGPEKTVCYIRY